MTMRKKGRLDSVDSSEANWKNLATEQREWAVYLQLEQQKMEAVPKKEKAGMLWGRHITHHDYDYQTQILVYFASLEEKVWIKM